MTPTKVLTLAAVGCLAVAGVSIGTWYFFGSEAQLVAQAAAAKAAKEARYKREEEPYRLTVLSHVISSVNGRPASSIPVMIKMVVLGSRGLMTVCGRMPHVREAVLRTLSPKGAAITDASGRLDLAMFEPRLHNAVKAAISADVVKSVNAVMLGSANGTTGANVTKELCQEALKTAKKSGKASS